MRKSEIVLVEGARTAFAEFGGSFRDVSAIDLGAASAREAMIRSKVDPEEVDQVVMGNVIQSSPDAVFVGRHVGLKAGIPKHVPGLTVNRLCGSINEAFAAQYLGCQKLLDFDPEIGNVNGGAVALGHPLAASGTRITLSMIYELRRRGKKYGTSSLCIGGGQGIAAIWELL